MNSKIQNQLLEASGKDKGDLSLDNPYREIGFDGFSRRLGWMRVNAFSDLKPALQKLSSFFNDKDNFIFVGMGGSVNGIKPLLTLFNDQRFHALDSLDPQALKEIISRVKNLDKTAVISISKSGTTQETQLLSLSLKELFLKQFGLENWQKHFLWLSDPESFEKLDALGWQDTKKVPIQIDSATDIGGRFSSPHTLIFLLPLFLLLKEDFDQLEKIYQTFLKRQEEIRSCALSLAEKFKDKPEAYFSPAVDERIGDSFSSWIVQLFQESLGSKQEDLAVKTITNFKCSKKFSSLNLDIKIADPVASLMSQMYFFQVFIAGFSAYKEINFVTQKYVEKYKNQMRALEQETDQSIQIKMLNLEDVIDALKTAIGPEQDFIELVLYFYPNSRILETLRQKFNQAFPEKQTLIFIGSDWNHQSYQAAFASQDTFYLLLVAKNYHLDFDYLSRESLEKNTKTLKLIAKATQLTLEDKSLLFSLA